MRETQPPFLAQEGTTMQITVQIKSVYGEDKVYPVCEKAKLFASIARTTTLTTATIERIKELGYTLKLDLPVDMFA